MPRPERLEQIYTIVEQIPAGRVTTYGRIAAMTDGATPRMVGAALRHLPADHQLPWHRVIAASLKLADHAGAERQEQKLRDEGVVLDSRGRVSCDLVWPD